jgi:hypothetical protein
MYQSDAREIYLCDCGLAVLKVVAALSAVAAGVAIASVVPAASLASTPAPTPTWTQQFPATSPPARSNASMAFDQGTNELVLFGGWRSFHRDDTWTYDGTTWTQQFPATTPPARLDASMAFDPASGELVLFGGYSYSGGYRNDTWTYDGTTWTQQSPAVSPSARADASMAFDPATGQLVLFGGYGGFYKDDTWTYDGTTWIQQFPTTRPLARFGASMAFDPASGELVLFGGYTFSGSYQDDTWTYDGTTWTQQTPAVSPSARRGASMAFDPASGELVLFGGDGGPRFEDTWTYDGTTWTQQLPAVSPSARSGASMAFDPATGQLVLFGGFGGGGSYHDDTWTYQAAFGPPAATINSPADHQSYPLDQLVETDFSCAEAPGGPRIVSCLDSNGSESPGKLDTSTKGNHSYVVTATADDGQVGTASIEYLVVKATPVLTTQASPDVLRGKAVTDKAVLSSGHSSGGNITFRLYGPHDAKCSRAPVFSDVASVSGNGSYESAPFIAKAPGTYRWVASYSGDPNNEAVAGSCNDPGESVQVVPPCRFSPVLAGVNRTSRGGGRSRHLRHLRLTLPRSCARYCLRGRGHECACGFLSSRLHSSPPARACWVRHVRQHHRRTPTP